MTFTAMGTTLTGHASGWPKSSDSGTVRPWSTVISLMMVMSNSSRMSDWARWHAKSESPTTGGMGRGPQPSSAMGKTSAQPIAKVGIISREKAEAWSL